MPSEVYRTTLFKLVHDADIGSGVNAGVLRVECRVCGCENA